MHATQNPCMQPEVLGGMDVFDLRISPVRAALGAGFVGLILALGTQSAYAQTESKAFPAETYGSIGTDEDASIRLFMPKTRWDRVLRNYAEQAGLTLVMDRVPYGGFQHRHPAKYTKTRARQILNDALQQEGFRLIEKQGHLVVMNLKEARSTYHRKPLPEAAEPTPQKVATPEPSKLPARRFDTIPISESSIKTAEAWSDGRSHIQPVQASTPTEFFAGEQPQEPTPQKRQSETAHSVYQSKHLAVGHVAKKIYEALADRSALLKTGEVDLPTVRVYARKGNGSRDASKVAFSMGIDRAENALHLFAPAEKMKQLRQLVAGVDREDEAGEQTRVVQGTPAASRIATKLQPQINTLVARGDRVPTRLTAQVQPAPQAPEGGEGGAAIAGGLRSEVNLEALPDLGAIIIRGNQADVDAVMKVIEQLEDISVGTAPEINIRTLDHVNSTALAELLTQIYDQLNTLRSSATGTDNEGSTAFIAVGQPNAVLILAPKREIEPINETIDKLDKPTVPESEFQMFRLGNAISSQVAEQIDTLYADPTGLEPRVTVVNDVRSNSLIVQANPRDLAQIAALVNKLDTDAVGAAHRVRVFKLKNAIADELSDVINETIQNLLNPAQQTAGQAGAGGGTAQNSTALREIKSVVLEILSAEGENGEQLIRSGTLADVRVTPDARTNSLIVTATEQTLKVFELLIQRLDQQTDTVAEIKVFTLENADATQAVELLSTIFGDAADTTGSIGLQIAGAEDASSSLVPLIFSEDVRTNTVVAFGGADALRIVEAILLRLDESDLRERETRVIELQNSAVEDIADALAAFVQQQQDLLAQVGDGLVSNIELLDSEVVVQAEPTTNTLLLQASPRYLNKMLDIVGELDRTPSQVVVQALIVEVELNNTDEFGMELGFQEDVLFQRSVLENYRN